MTVLSFWVSLPRMWGCQLRQALCSFHHQLKKGFGILPASTHWHHTVPTSPSCAWQLNDGHLELKYRDTLMRFDYFWLRDHCRSPSCYNTKTNQRSLDTASVDLTIKPQAVRVDETTLFLTWPDGHVTKYGLEWLLMNSYEGQKQQVMQPRILWNADIYQDAQVPSVDYHNFLETNEGLREFLQNFLLYGIAFVENVPPTKDDTEIIAERISLIRETIYGRMWYFTSDFSRGDTAYTKLALDRHTDTTYFQEPCGIQVFHCLRHEGTGGRTLLVDGFYAAEQVLQRAPEDFDLLTKVPLRHEYIENMGSCHNHMIGVGPVLNIYPWNKELYLISCSRLLAALCTRALGTGSPGSSASLLPDSRGSEGSTPLPDGPGSISASDAGPSSKSSPDSRTDPRSSPLSDSAASAQTAGEPQHL
uniref:Trimethyllysine dioxygenase, mitochondrial n=1 Tax=Naja naja TaxID=35670 RepID=A0A8C6XQ63_NAJNA